MGSALVVVMAVKEEKRLQEAKLGNREIRYAGGLEPFLARDTDSNMLYHARSAWCCGGDIEGKLTEAWIMAMSFAPSWNKPRHQHIPSNNMLACTKRGNAKHQLGDRADSPQWPMSKHLGYAL